MKVVEAARRYTKVFDGEFDDMDEINSALAEYDALVGTK